MSHLNKQEVGFIEDMLFTGGVGNLSGLPDYKEATFKFFDIF